MKRKIHKEDIIKAGLDLMFLHGYNATGIKEITHSIGIPKGSFYNHFSSKEEFGLEVVKFYCDRGLDWHRKELLSGKLSPIERLNAFYTDVIASYESEMDCKLGCVMGNFSLEMADVNEHFRALLDSKFNQFEEVITQCLKEAQDKGELGDAIDPALMGGFILNSWHGALVRMKSTGTVKPLMDFKTLIFQHLVN